MVRFAELDMAQFSGTIVLLDIDGTLTALSGDAVAEPERHALERLKREAEVYLFSNKSQADRNEKIAREAGVPLLTGNFKKPDPRVLRPIVRRGRPLFVIGDKVTTDGLLAFFSGATFVHVSRVPGRNRLFDAFWCVLDDAVSAIVRR